MIGSIRRITLTVFVITIVALVAGVFSTDFSFCANVVKCVANVSLYSIDATTHAQSTSQLLTDTRFDWKLFNEVMRVISLYAVLASLLILISLEFFELHFLKILLLKRSRK